MNTRRRTILTLAGAFLALPMTSANAGAQATKPAGKMPRMEGMKGTNEQEESKAKKANKDMKGMKGMNGMMEGPHHALAMAYRDNIATFARALRSNTASTKTVDVNLARPAVAEMRRNFDQMRQQHEAHKASMAGTMDPAMAEPMQKMEARVTGLNDHISALESAVSANVPEPMVVTDHASAIIKACAGMSMMSGKGMSMKK